MIMLVVSKVSTVAVASEDGKVLIGCIVYRLS